MTRHVSTFAIRRDWPDGGHEYFRLSRSPGDAQAGIEADRTYWRRRGAPVRPTSYRIVEISEHDFDLHRDRQHCHAPDCP